MWILAAFFVAWNLLRIWPGERIGLVAFVNYFTLWLALGLMILVVVALLLGDRPLAIGLTLAAALMGMRFLPNFRSLPLTRESLGQISVMTFNIHKTNPNPREIVDIILSADADIVALQETSQEMSAALVDSLAETYPYNTLGEDQFAEGQALLSRFPVTPLSPLPDYRYQKVIIEAPIGRITVLNVHTPKLLPIGFRESWEEQKEFVQALSHEVSRVSGPLLLVGDFNTTPQSENYALLSGALRDAFVERGNGFGFTYPASPKLGIQLPFPLVRIDYVFCSRDFSPASARVVEQNGGSDHFPVVAVLDLDARQDARVIDLSW